MYTYPVPYLEFLAHYHIDLDYFECHELLEEYWKKTDGSRDSIWVGLIQSAVFLYHYRRGNLNGAQRMGEKALQCFIEKPQELMRLGLDPDLFIARLELSLERLQKGFLFKPIFIPILDEKLKTELQQFSETFECETNQEFLIHKHKLRDRTEVLKSRELALAIKKAGKVTL